MLGFLSRKHQGTVFTLSFVVRLQRLTPLTGKTYLSVIAINKLGDFDRFAVKEQRCRLTSGHILVFHGLGIFPMNNLAALILSMGDFSFKGGSGRRQVMVSSHCSLCSHSMGESIMAIPGATSGPLPWLLAQHEIGDDQPSKVFYLVSSRFPTYVWAWALFGQGFGHEFGWFRVYPVATSSLRHKDKKKL